MKTRVKFNFVVLVVTYVFDNVSFYWHLLIMLSILPFISVIIHLQNITYVIQDIQSACNTTYYYTDTGYIRHHAIL